MKIVEINDETYNRFTDYCDFNGSNESETLSWLMDEARSNISKKVNHLIK